MRAAFVVAVAVASAAAAPAAASESALRLRLRCALGGRGPRCRGAGNQTAGNTLTIWHADDAVMQACSALMGSDFSCEGSASGPSSGACHVKGMAAARASCAAEPRCVGIIHSQVGPKAILTLKRAHDWSVNSSLLSGEGRYARRHRRCAALLLDGPRRALHASRCPVGEAKQWLELGCPAFLQAGGSALPGCTKEAGCTRAQLSAPLSLDHLVDRGARPPPSCHRLLLGFVTAPADWLVRARLRRLYRFHSLGEPAAEGGGAGLRCGLNPVFVVCANGRPRGRLRAEGLGSAKDDTAFVPCREKDKGDGGKTFAWFRWAAENVPSADFILKVDTDTQLCPDLLSTRVSEAIDQGAVYFGHRVDHHGCCGGLAPRQCPQCPPTDNSWSYMSGALYGMHRRLALRISGDQWCRRNAKGVAPWVFEDVLTGKMVLRVWPRAPTYHLGCMYEPTSACPARHRQFNKPHATEKLLCDEMADDVALARCNCGWWPLPGPQHGQPYCDARTGSVDPRPPPGSSPKAVTAAALGCVPGCTLVRDVHDGRWGDASQGTGTCFMERALVSVSAGVSTSPAAETPRAAAPAG